MVAIMTCNFMVCFILFSLVKTYIDCGKWNGSVKSSVPSFLLQKVPLQSPESLEKKISKMD